MADCGHLFLRDMGWKTIVIGCESKVSISLGRMKVNIDNEYHNFPLCDIDSVIFSHDKVVITIPLLSELIKNNINVIICNEKNDPIGIFQPFNGHSLAFKQLNKQINWKLTRKKKLWKIIVENKIQTEIDCLKLVDANSNALEQLKAYKESVYTNDQTNREASSARVYFNSLFGSGFNRDNDNVINYALNYGYKIVASYISKCIASRGLITQLGIHHIGESNPFNLTYDFIETFRSIVDLRVVKNIKEEFKISHKLELVEILNYKIRINDKWIRLCDGIEDIIDSYIAFLDEREDQVLNFDLSNGIYQVDDTQQE